MILDYQLPSKLQTMLDYAMLTKEKDDHESVQNIREIVARHHQEMMKEIRGLDDDEDGPINYLDIWAIRWITDEVTDFLMQRIVDDDMQGLMDELMYGEDEDDTDTE